jgi:hypothetical protein
MHTHAAAKKLPIKKGSSIHCAAKKRYLKSKKRTAILRYTLGASVTLSALILAALIYKYRTTPLKPVLHATPAARKPIQDLHIHTETLSIHSTPPAHTDSSAVHPILPIALRTPARPQPSSDPTIDPSAGARPECLFSHIGLSPIGGEPLAMAINPLEQKCESRLKKQFNIAARAQNKSSTLTHAETPDALLFANASWLEGRLSAKELNNVLILARTHEAQSFFNILIARLHTFFFYTSTTEKKLYPQINASEIIQHYLDEQLVHDVATLIPEEWPDH